MAVTAGEPAEEPAGNLETPATFQALVHQYDFEQQANPGREVELGTTFHPRGLSCRLRAHAWDHLYVLQADGARVLIPVGALTYIAWISHDTRFPD